MTLSTDYQMTLEEYLDYDDGTDTRYELVDGVLVEMGAENDVNLLIATFLLITLSRLVPYFCLRKGTEIAVPSDYATSRFPDLVVLTEAGEAALPLNQRSLITFEMPAPALVVEVVSPGAENQERDYITKRREYAARSIPEYWIVDPHAALVTVCKLVGGQYESTAFRGDALLVSSTFPGLNLTAAQVLAAGR